MEYQAVVYAGQEYKGSAARDLCYEISSALERGKNTETAFDFMYQVFETLLAKAPNAIADCGRYYNPEHNPDYRSRQNMDLIELQAAFAYDRNPVAKDMARHALAKPYHPLMETALRHYVHLIELGEDYKPLEAINLRHDPASLSKKLPFTGDVIDLWESAHKGRFTEALDRLIPLVNLLAEQESKGVFPLGISRDGGVSMSDIRYQVDNHESIWAINETTPENKTAISLAIDARPHEFSSDRARIYAKNMLAMMADPKAGLGTSAHLPGDLQWLMVCEDNQRNGKAVKPQYEGHTQPEGYAPPRPLIQIP